MRRSICLSILFLIFHLAYSQFDKEQEKLIKGRKLEIKAYDSVLNAFRFGIQDSVFDYLFYHEKSWNFIRSTRYDSALYFAELGLNKAIQRQDTAQLISFNKQLGISYYYATQREKAKQCFLKALSFWNGKYSHFNAAALNNNLGGIYADLHEYDSADYHLRQAIRIYESMDSSMLPYILQSKRLLATNLEHQDKLSQAKEILLEVLKDAVRINHPVQKTGALVYLAAILEKEGRFLSALDYLKEAYQIQKNEKHKDAMLLTCSNLAGLFAKNNQYDSAFYYGKKESLLRMEIYQKDLAENVSSLEVKYETKRAKIEKQLAEETSKNKSLELAVSKRKLSQSIAIGILVCLLLLSALIFLIQQRKVNKEKQKQALQLERTQSIIEGEEHERERLSRELHDGVGQLLAGVKLNFNAIGFSDKNTLELLDKSIQEVRTISHELMPEELKNKNVFEALSSLFKKYKGLKNPELSFKGEPIDTLDKQKQKHLYRIAQELLSNGIKHSQAKSIQIDLKKEGDNILLEYKDDGKGLSKKVLHLSSGIGWRNILARLELLNGSVAIKNNALGTSLSIKIPCHE